ncbi:hypothetical protein QBC41DRAFT_105244 [Cercophora samala]|uniref:Uncharacterized protein n=1 Tax=Cercophora samala TaxID=330535 RepID=A0AA39ZEN3_9PEZI|nr:hypothetical protein QBC41DRAFT_105244 [Cercophora samala]
MTTMSKQQQRAALQKLDWEKLTRPSFTPTLLLPCHLLKKRLAWSLFYISAVHTKLFVLTFVRSIALGVSGLALFFFSSHQCGAGIIQHLLIINHHWRRERESALGGGRGGRGVGGIYTHVPTGQESFIFVSSHVSFFVC